MVTVSKADNYVKDELNWNGSSQMRYAFAGTPKLLLTEYDNMKKRSIVLNLFLAFFMYSCNDLHVYLQFHE